MPHPMATRSLEAFDKEHVNNVIHIPDYKLRSKLCLEQKEAGAIVVEAFSAFDVMFYLHLGWAQGGSCYPCMSLSLASSQCHKLAIDLHLTSPSFSYVAGENPAQIVNCSWSTTAQLVEVHKTTTIIPLTVDRPPTHHNDTHITLEQIVTLTFVGTLWKLELQPTDSLWCASYRARKNDAEPDLTGILIGMVENIASMQAMDTDPSGRIQIKLDEESAMPSEAHAFVLQAHSPVFRRMLDSNMTEATERVVSMANVTLQELDDLVSCLYQMRIPKEVQDDESRLLALLALSDRYEILELHSVCAAVLSKKLTEANMTAVLKVADMHNAHSLRKAALQFISCRMERIIGVMDTDDKCLRAVLRDHLMSDEVLGRADERDSRLQVLMTV